MIIFTISLILITLLIYIYYILFKKNSEIKWYFKVLDFILGIISLHYCKIGTNNFNRKRVNKIENFFNKEKFDTNKKFIKGVMIEDVIIESQWKEDPYFNKKIPIKIFIKEQIQEKNAENFNTENINIKQLPILVNIHGGGFVLEFNDDKSELLSRENMIVISIKYRLAPEHKYPTALEDCYSVFDYISKKKNSTLNKYADYDKISIIGDSAGGNLAALIPFLIKERNLPIRISQQILIYPTMLIKGETESLKRLKGKDYILPNDLMQWFIKAYLGPDYHKLYEDKFVSPLKQKNFDGIPEALIILATQDILYSDGILYSELLTKKNVINEIKEFESVHGFYSAQGLPEEKEANKIIFEYLRRNKFIC